MRLLLATVMLSAMVCHVSVRGADRSETAYAQGQQQLANADFQGALRSFASAAKVDRTNAKYLEAFAILKQVITLRDQLDSQEDEARWDYMARALHSYYISQKVYTEALALDQKIHRRMNNDKSATMLAETQLAMRLDADAAEMLTALSDEQHTVNTRALWGLALVRSGKLKQGREIAKSIELSDEAGPGVAYSMARLCAALGDAEQAMTLLRRTFEGIPPSRLDGFKYHAAHSPEFAAMVSTPAFAKILETQSNVSESQCSSGSSCATCPMRGQCNSGN